MQNYEFLSRFSHELRNPLTLICSSLQLLEKECPAVRESELWDQIRKDMLDVLQLLKEISVPSGEVRPEPVDLTEFLAGLSASFAPAMEMRGICFVTELPDEPSGMSVIADRQKLRQAVTNLLLNAADAVSDPSVSGVSTRSDPKCPAAGKIILSTVRDGAEVCIHVRDNGPGIPQEFLGNLFEPFVTHKAGGTGLGLNIARAIAEQHGGSISVDTCCGRQTAQDGSAPGIRRVSGTVLPDTCRDENVAPMVPDRPAKESSFTDFCLRLPVSGPAAS